MDAVKLRSHGSEAWRVGLALVAIAGLLAALGGGVQWAAVPTGALGILLLLLGFVARQLTPDLTLSDKHVERLRTSARVASERLQDGLVCEYGENGHRPREAFHAHFPEAGAKIEEWDSLVEEDRASREALRQKVEAEARYVALTNSAPGDFEGIASVVFNSTLGRAHRLELDLPFSLLDVGEKTVNLPRDPGEPSEEWLRRVNGYIGQVQAMGQASQAWPEARAVEESHRHLESFKQEKRAELLEELQLIQERPPNYATKCPTCRSKRK